MLSEEEEKKIIRDIKHIIDSAMSKTELNIFRVIYINSYADMNSYYNFVNFSSTINQNFFKGDHCSESKPGGFFKFVFKHKEELRLELKDYRHKEIMDTIHRINASYPSEAFSSLTTPPPPAPSTQAASSSQDTGSLDTSAITTLTLSSPPRTKISVKTYIAGTPINLNCQISNKHGRNITCRHFSGYIRKNNTKKKLLGSLTSKDAIKHNSYLMNNTWDLYEEKLKGTHYYIFDKNQLGETLYRLSDLIKDNTSCSFILLTANHACVIRIKNNDLNVFSIRWYNPNKTNAYLIVDRLPRQALLALNFEDFLSDKAIIHHKIHDYPILIISYENFHFGKVTLLSKAHPLHISHILHGFSTPRQFQIKYRMLNFFNTPICKKSNIMHHFDVIIKNMGNHKSFLDYDILFSRYLENILESRLTSRDIILLIELGKNLIRLLD